MTIILIIIITTLALASLAASASAAIALWSWIGRRASLLQIIRMIIRLKMMRMKNIKKVTINIQKVSSLIQKNEVVQNNFRTLDSLTHISTLSTLMPHGSVASSSIFCGWKSAPLYWNLKLLLSLSFFASSSIQDVSEKKTSQKCQVLDCFGRLWTILDHHDQKFCPKFMSKIVVMVLTGPYSSKTVQAVRSLKFLIATFFRDSLYLN